MIARKKKKSPLSLLVKQLDGNEITPVIIRDKRAVGDAQFLKTLHEGGLYPHVLTGSAAHFYFVRKVWRVYQGYQVYRSKPWASLIYNTEKKTIFLIKLIEIVTRYTRRRSFCHLRHACSVKHKSFRNNLSFYIWRRDILWIVASLALFPLIRIRVCENFWLICNIFQFDGQWLNIYNVWYSDRVNIACWKVTFKL